MNVLKRLWVAAIADPDFIEEVKARRRKREDEERASRRQNLNLCYAHRQEQNHSCYSAHNCHYCQLLEENKTLREELGNE